MSERLTEGVLLQVDKTTVPGATWATLAEMTSIDGPDWSRSALDRTKLATIGPRRFRPGRADAGEVTLEYTFDPDSADHAWLAAERSTKVDRSWRILIPKETSAGKDFYIMFDGFLTAYKTSVADEDGFITASVTIKVDGEAKYELAA